MCHSYRTGLGSGNALFFVDIRKQDKQERRDLVEITLPYEWQNNMPYSSLLTPAPAWWKRVFIETPTVASQDYWSNHMTLFKMHISWGSAEVDTWWVARELGGQGESDLMLQRMFVLVTCCQVSLNLLWSLCLSVASLPQSRFGMLGPIIHGYSIGLCCWSATSIFEHRSTLVGAFVWNGSPM